MTPIVHVSIDDKGREKVSFVRRNISPKYKVDWELRMKKISRVLVDGALLQSEIVERTDLDKNQVQRTLIRMAGLKRVKKMTGLRKNTPVVVYKQMKRE